MFFWKKKASDSTSTGNSRRDPFLTERFTIPYRAYTDCLLQQTTNYQSGEPYLICTDEENNIYLLNYYSNCFYIFRVSVVNGKINIINDYRKESVLLKDFQYKMDKDRVNIRFETGKARIDFSVSGHVDTAVGDYFVIRDQQIEYVEFCGYLDTYHNNICSAGEAVNEQLSDRELKKIFATLPPSDRERITSFAREGQLIKAIKACQDATGLGLFECKKIIDSKLYF